MLEGGEKETLRHAVVGMQIGDHYMKKTLWSSLKGKNRVAI